MSANRQTLRFPAEVALVGVTLASLAGFRRVFVDWTFLGKPLLLAIAAHALVGGLRRRRIPLPTAAAIHVVVGVIACAFLLYNETLRWGLPTGVTWDLFIQDAREAAQLFRDVKAPAEVVPGFLAGVALAAWIVPFLSDWSAFRVWAPFEATLPSIGLFVFGSLFGADIRQLGLTVVFLLATGTFLLLFRTARQEVSATWVRGESHQGSRALLRSGALLGGLAVVGGLVLAPFVPGARTGGLLDWKDLGGGRGTRVTLSPLVDIQSRLVEQRDIEVFTVRSDERSYWRLTALDAFDGRLWRSSKRFSKTEGGSLSRENESRAPVAAVTQQFTIEALEQIWLPAAFEPRSVQADDAGTVRWEPSTATLIVDEPSSDGLVYEVTSALPTFDPADLRAAPTQPPANIAAQYLDLPADFSANVAAEAARITSPFSSTFDKSLALQNYFRENFAYSLDVTNGHSGDRLDQFVFDDRAGYCEQFAGTFAAMARSVGIPARVAVGFTPGEQDPDDPSLYHVLGRHAHAWPEVYIAEFGWVLMEPTPSRGAPRAEYTGVSESQDSPQPIPEPDTDTSTTLPNLPPEFNNSGPIAEGFNEFPEIDSAPVPSNTDGGGTRLLAFLGAVIGIVALYAGVVGGAQWLRRALRRRQARTPLQHVDLAWTEAAERLAILGLHPSGTETPKEFAERAASRLRSDASPMIDLAALTTEARYSGQDVPTLTVQLAEEKMDDVDTAVRKLTSTQDRLKYRYSPKSLVMRARR